ncbi:hypothetical protein ACGFZA_13985 [Streptomyces sp. NPDC048211]|uniref:hypothetical protein n=1 Tax=Streptomyces sp. NPDC048211 TaxID=3365516 RepID=UPI00370F8F33
MSSEDYRAGIKAPGVRLVPQNIGSGDSFAVYPADDHKPMGFAFTTGDRSYHLEVIPARDGDYPRYEQGDIGTKLLRLLIPAIESSRN